MMRVNGQETEEYIGKTVREMVAMMKLSEQRIAVEVNREIVPKAEYETHVLQNEDHIEVVHFVGGG